MGEDILERASIARPISVSFFHTLRQRKSLLINLSTATSRRLFPRVPRSQINSAPRRADISFLISDIKGSSFSVRSTAVESVGESRERRRDETKRLVNQACSFSSYGGRRLAIMRFHPSATRFSFFRYPFLIYAVSGRGLCFLLHFVRVVTAFCFVLHRSGTVWENCRAAYEDIVKHLER